MPAELDENGQPTNRAFGWQRLKDSRFDELIGLCRGILADGVIVSEEARYLRDWLERNPPVRTRDEGKQLYSLLLHAFRGGALEACAETQLVDLIVKIVGGTPRDKADASFSSTLPLDDPQPSVCFPGKSFCFTGKFKFGGRTMCQNAVIKVGGIIHGVPKRETSFLVIGEIGSRDWVHSNSGRKIERAVELRTSSSGIAIISEQTWHVSLEGCV